MSLPGFWRRAAFLLAIVVVACAPREMPAPGPGQPLATTRDAWVLGHDDDDPTLSGFDGLPGNADAPADAASAAQPAPPRKLGGVTMSVLAAGITVGAMIAPYLLF